MTHAPSCMSCTENTGSTWPNITGIGFADGTLCQQQLVVDARVWAVHGLLATAAAAVHSLHSTPTHCCVHWQKADSCFSPSSSISSSSHISRSSNSKGGLVPRELQARQAPQDWLITEPHFRERADTSVQCIQRVCVCCSPACRP